MCHWARKPLAGHLLFRLAHWGEVSLESAARPTGGRPGSLWIHRVYNQDASASASDSVRFGRCLCRPSREDLMAFSSPWTMPLR